MSGTANEFESPGGNYPDSGAAEPGEVGAAVGRQEEPALDMNDATVDDKLAGIVVQTRADVGSDGTGRVTEVLRQRLDDAGLDLTDDEIAALAHRVADGSSDGR